jgi:hypothetical protein
MKDSVGKGKFWTFIEHPRTGFTVALILAVLAFLAPHWIAYPLIVIIVFIVARSLWEWDPFRRQIPFDFRSPIVSRAIKVLPPPPPEMGMLDFELLQAEASSQMNGVSAKMTKEMDNFGAKIGREAKKVGQLAGAKIQTRHRKITKISKGTLKYARKLREREEIYRIHVTSFTTNSLKMLSRAPSGIDATFRDATTGLRTASVNTRNSMAGFRDASIVQRNLNMSQALNVANEELIEVLNQVVEDYDTMINYCDEVLKISTG